MKKTGEVRLQNETIINFNEAEDIAYIYTASKFTYLKLKKNPMAKLTKVYRLARGNHKISGWDFEFPKKMLSFRSKRIKRNLTDEQKKAAADRLRKNVAKAKVRNG